MLEQFSLIIPAGLQSPHSLRHLGNRVRDLFPAEKAVHPATRIAYHQPTIGVDPHAWLSHDLVRWSAVFTAIIPDLVSSQQLSQPMDGTWARDRRHLPTGCWDD
jgi:hypothetical protein